METNEKIHNVRHSLAHLLAAAVLEIYPETKVTIGPVIENGFYYDFDMKSPISDKDLPKIEKKMREILKSWQDFKVEEKTQAEALEYFRDNEYKTELINEIADKDEKITLYTFGNFTDLCRGGHSKNPAKEISPDSFKLDRIAGAYWRGDENNKMLTRIYGLAFETKEELENFIAQREEAKKRDHKKLGHELGLFTTSELIGPGLPLIKPKGMIIRKAVTDFLWDLHKNKGYSQVWTPHIAKEKLYETSGHAAKFGDELFRVQGKEDKFFMKPMNCPHHMQIFADDQFSYRDMPVRYFEPATVYRDEKSGQLGGLTRVRSITQDDGHLFCRRDQIEKEVGTIVSIIREFFTAFDMMNNYWVSLSVRGKDLSKYLGDEDGWRVAEEALENAAKENKLNYKRVEGEAAFYGPKLDFMFKDSIGREWQLSTIQCDFNLPERFDLSFTNEKGEKERPVVIHRAISGSLERFMGMIIEHYAGAFPLWLSPTQIVILPISEKQVDFADEIYTELKNADVRVELNSSNESLGKRIRAAKMQKVPHIIVIGDKEKESGKLTVEGRNDEKLENISIKEFIKKINEQIEQKK
ncbi:MAG TPA: threonine--tRNA ligase [Candidatus Paceibacterota bacterium]|nr:threonine--tRNA ligase [Candidatus Paceibacterota bacterium]